MLICWRHVNSINFGLFFNKFTNQKSLSTVASSPSTITEIHCSILTLLSITHTTSPLTIVLLALYLKIYFELKDFLPEEGNKSIAALVVEVKEGEQPPVIFLSQTVCPRFSIALDL